MFKNKNFFVSALALSILLIIGSFSGCELTDGDKGLNSSGDYPIILLHGFLGWGRDEVGGPKGHFHWGGYDDLQSILSDSGHTCYTAVVGPFSSNWDRACELYAQLKGSRTDYGLAHSVAHNHARFAEEGKIKDYRGKALIKDWGKDSQNKKIHIIAHSQGGHTARILAQLLENGKDSESKAVKTVNGKTVGLYEGEEPISPLFTGTAETKNLIHSITTMAATHNGTTLANSVIKFIPFIESLLVNFIALVGVDDNETFFNFYDFKLQQFGLSSRQHGEKIDAYVARMRVEIKEFLGGDRKDTCIWDLSPEGAREQNSWVFAQDNIYYFSFAGKATQKALLPDMLDNWEKHQIPESNVALALMPLSLMMGSYTCNDSRYHGLWRARDGDFFKMPVKDRPRIDSSWWPNDGVVNTISMNGPWLYTDNFAGKKDEIVNWDKKSVPEKGVWNFGGVFNNLDHWDIPGMEVFWYDRDNYISPEFAKHAEDWYLGWADVLKSIE